MQRRKFLRSAAIGGIAMTGMSGAFAATASAPEAKMSNRAKFNLKYAPSPDLSASSD